jgi:rhodanese-related sulfurtransferase
MKNIIIIISTFLILASCNPKEGITEKGVNQTCEASIIEKDDLVNLLYAKDLKNIQFIDIRTPHQYAIGHLPNAINMPMNNFFSKKEFKKINKDDVLILYGDDGSTPQMMALMAGHFTNSKFYIAGGGYEFINDKILNGYGIHSELYNDELPIVDFKNAVEELKKRVGGVTTTKKTKSSSKKTLVKRKKKAVSGGCG